MGNQALFPGFAGRRGSTLVEVMMAITVLAIGATGVIALQKVAMSANRHSRSIAVANEVARTWVERLRTDAMLWNYPSPTNPTDDFGDTMWLSGRVVEQNQVDTAWFRPMADGITCGIHDVFGRDGVCGSPSAVLGPYCVNLRLSWIRREHDTVRAEVRVYWVVSNQGDDALDPKDMPCGDGEKVPDVDALAEAGVVRVVHAVTAVTKNEAP